MTMSDAMAELRREAEKMSQNAQKDAQKAEQDLKAANEKLQAAQSSLKEAEISNQTAQVQFMLTNQFVTLMHRDILTGSNQIRLFLWVWCDWKLLYEFKLKL